MHSTVPHPRYDARMGTPDHPTDPNTQRYTTSTDPTQTPAPNADPHDQDSTLEKLLTPQAHTQTHEVDPELANYRKAFEQEFKRGEAAQQKIDDLFVSHGPQIAQNVLDLAYGSGSDRVRLDASKYVVDYVNRLSSGVSGDPFHSLIAKLLPDNQLSEITTDPPPIS